MDFSDYIKKNTIPEPTKSLLWVSNEDSAKRSDPNRIIINVNFDQTTKKISTSEGNKKANEINGEPSLIWSKLPIEKSDSSVTNGYFPTNYFDLNPKQRYQYLNWLTDITQQTSVNFILLYFHGLQRHLLLGDYDLCVKEILRIWENHSDASLKYYIPLALNYSSVFRNKFDIFEKAPFLLEYATNPDLYIQQRNGISISAKQIMDAAKDVGFEKIYLIRKWKNVIEFESLLQEKIDAYETSNGKILDYETKHTSNEYFYNFITNNSISHEIAKTSFPNYIKSNIIKFVLYDLLKSTYEEIKSKPNVKSHRQKTKQVKLNPRIASAGSITKENLPYPYVYYPSSYGAFFGFKKELKSQMYLCSCAREAIKNYLLLRKDNFNANYGDKSKNYLLSSRDFPTELVEDMINKGYKDTETIFNHLNFEDNLCHECNKSTPTLSYTLPMYGGLFLQKYGWYVKKTAYELGISLGIDYYYLPEISPTNITNAIEERKPIREKLFEELKRVGQGNGKYYEIQSELLKQNQSIKNIVENITRLKFGHKKIGESWSGETILYHLIQNIYPNYEVIHHHRPKFLEGLELDIFIKELNIGVEYQGIQHYQPVNHWGGQESFEKLQERDKKKFEIANKLGVKIIYFYYYDDLSEEMVANRIKN